MARPTNEELAEKNQNMFDKLQTMISGLSEKVSSLEEENQMLKERKADIKGKKFVAGKNGTSSEWHAGVLERNNTAEHESSAPIIKKEVGFQGRENECPWCNSLDRHNLLDLNMKSGRFQCRTCGKTWKQENLKQEYSLAIERDY